MSPAQLERRKAENLPGYAQLLKDVRNTLLLGRERIEREKVLTYWKTGRLIHQHLLRSKERAGYGEFVMVRLAKDLNLELTILKRCLRFARLFPKGAARHQLSWTHYRALIAIPDEKKRLELADRAARLQWTSTELEEKIKRDFGRDPSSTQAPPLKKDISSFKPKRGIVGAYRVILSDVLMLDLGFSNFLEHPALKSGRFKEGNIVRAPFIASPAKQGRLPAGRQEAISV